MWRNVFPFSVTWILTLGVVAHLCVTSLLIKCVWAKMASLPGAPSTTPNIWCQNPGEGERDLPIEFLIGGDCYWRTVKDASTIRLSSSLVLLPTKFGWILTGNRTGLTATPRAPPATPSRQADGQNCQTGPQHACERTKYRILHLTTYGTKIFK